ncbi:hypothetical protein CAPTEDRAFT_192056 [Capitella teleta]|uniref:Uncharacterized protein n=1 Tax=Capitella teleta TaxID=283909 RepID=R7TSY3_CAPTE|nr:hypothetical protein CAPTEDRAFT_192056 [Capitella teleta]|eukprot:ELT96749.1 hypothetical protein CAPTEDRAFT_192056 [Capitella teleta]
MEKAPDYFKQLNVPETQTPLSCPFDARVFRARFVEHRKANENADDTKGVHVRASRNETEREKYRKNKEIVRKLNDDAKQGDPSKISFSLRDNIAIWKFEKDGDSLRNTLHAILCEIKAYNEETKALKEEIATLKLSNDALCIELSELKCVSSSTPTSASKDSTSSVKFADVVKQSVRSVFHDDKSKNEIIMSKVKEGENDQQVFRARFVEHRKANENADDTKGVHVRASRNETEREKYRKNKEIVRKLNDDAKQGDPSKISFSLRDNIAIWKFEKDGKWKRIQDWSYAGN